MKGYLQDHGLGPVHIPLKKMSFLSVSTNTNCLYILRKEQGHMIYMFSRKMVTGPVLFRICAGSHSYLEFKSTRAKPCLRDRCSTTLCPFLAPSPLCFLEFWRGYFRWLNFDRSLSQLLLNCCDKIPWPSQLIGNAINWRLQVQRVSPWPSG